MKTTSPPKLLITCALPKLNHHVVNITVHLSYVLLEYKKKTRATGRERNESLFQAVTELLPLKKEKKVIPWCCWNNKPRAASNRGTTSLLQLLLVHTN
ncbi:hypothetical protein VIGAN_06063900 [Vigna angularis var. angularis]|uniref:Uncharacterized protein n=1 Tax=Vigna angularis var. angularis TaxID=157739 RepID=A0A0S3SA08_PHAAN|nr:hypothetical protein VIGAN_06063900 [Vigna angularis var. angularis]